MDEVGQEAEVDELGKIPAKAFFGNPLFSHVRLSPSGRRIAALVSSGENEVLMSIDLETGERVPLTVLERKERSHFLASQKVVGVGWASEDIVAMSVSRPIAGPGFMRRQHSLIVSDVRDPRARDLGKDWPFSKYLRQQDLVISLLPDDPGRLLLNWFGEVRRVDLKFSRLRSFEFKKKGIGAWAVDHEFIVRIGYSGERWTNEFEVWGRISDQDRIEKLVKWDPLDIEETGVGFYFAGFSEKPELIYIASERETGRYAVYEYDLRTREIGRAVFEHPEYEVYWIRTSVVDGRLLSVHYLEDSWVTRFVDAKYRRLWESVEQQFPGKTVSIESTDRNERSSIFVVSADDFSPVYYRLDHGTREFSRLFRARPTLDGQPLSKTESIRFRARDGLEISGYVTRPAHASDPTATIIFPHDGPFRRSVRGWDPRVQFFASRGFTVFQLNYRGSTGYGRKFREAGYQQYGRAMQDDITDGVQWLIAEGIADPDRIGIFGIGYGGYAALQGLVSTPELYAAGASYGGISNLDALLHDNAGYGFYSPANRVLLGARWSDRESLRAASPVHHATHIRVPVLLGHGTDDSISHVSHTDEMAAALEKAGVEHEVYRYRGETHDFLDERTRIDFYQKVGDFFERHLRPDPAHIRRPIALLPS